MNRGVFPFLCVAILGLAIPAFAASNHWFVVNEDNDHFFKLPSAEMTRKGLADYADFIARGHVTHVFLCVCGQRTSYGSKSWEPIWMGLNEQGRPDTATKPDGTHDRWAVNCKLLYDRGIDPYAVWIARFREKGVSPWLSMRMNDVHFGSDTNYFRNTSFYKSHPEWRFDPASGRWSDWQLDYARPEVRDYHLAQAREIVDRWDADGLELDWMRFGRVFRSGEERGNAPLLDAFMRDVRKAADAAGLRRGRPMKLAVRVPPTPEEAERLGFNVIDWAKEGLVDVIVADDFMDVLPDLPVDAWMARLRGTSARFLPGTGGTLPKSLSRGDAPAFYRELVARYCAHGAMGAYFFNLPYLSNVRYSTDGRGDDEHDVAAELYENGIFVRKGKGVGALLATEINSRSHGASRASKARIAP